jgi:hypothetical protein
MAQWNANAEVEQAYELRERAYLARTLEEENIALLFDQAARLAMMKAEIFIGLNEVHGFLTEGP